MSRQPKVGLDYFPFDVDFFSDKKIKILKSRYGADGVTVYIYLLTLIYRDKGYYTVYDDDLKFIIGDDLNMKDEKIDQIINFLLERSLFDNTLFRSDKVLTGHGIQLRYQKAKAETGKKRDIEVDDRFWVLNENETQGYIKCARFSGMTRSNDNSARSNDDFSREECHKEKKIKENKIKAKESTEEERQPASVPARNNGESLTDWWNRRQAERGGIK